MQENINYSRNLISFLERQRESESTPTWFQTMYLQLLQVVGEDSTEIPVEHSCPISSSCKLPSVFPITCWNTATKSCLLVTVQCNKLFNRPYTLKIHMLTHSVQHICSICSRWKTTPYNLAKHMLPLQRSKNA